MKICIANGNFNIGGQQRISWYLGKKLSEEHEIYFYSFHPTETVMNFDGLELEINNSKQNIRLIDKISRKISRKFSISNRKSYPAKEFSDRLDSLIHYLKTKEIDILIVSGGFLTSLSKNIKSRLPSIKVIAWQHSTAEVYLNQYYKDIIYAYKEGLKNSDAVVCLTKEDQEIFSQYNKNTLYIDNMLTIRANEDISKLQSKSIIFISRYSIEGKGIDLLFETVKLLPNDIKVLFAGSGTKKEIKKVKKMVSRMGLEKRIELLGPLNESEIRETYKKGSIFVSTSRWEGFGIVIAEAMEFGLPVVSFNTRGAKSIIGDNKYGKIIENLDTNEMANNIELILNSNALKTKYSDLSKKRAQDFYDQPIIAKWNELISKISE